MLPAVRSAVISSARRHANTAILLSVNVKSLKPTGAHTNTLGSWNQIRWEGTEDCPERSDQMNSNLKNSQKNHKNSDVPKKIDRSKVPTLNENELEEVFISGWGPGGQNVNKSVNCCQLRHKPTGLLVKVHASRSLEQNRKLARELLSQKLDDLYNGDDSVASQKKRLALHRVSIRESQAEKRRAMKEQLKKTLAMSKEEPDR